MEALIQMYHFLLQEAPHPSLLPAGERKDERRIFLKGEKDEIQRH
jgi:hypothetical protein